MKPEKPPALLLIISAGVGFLDGKNACKTSTVNDKTTLISKTIPSFAVASSPLACSRQVNPKPKGMNNNTLFI